jgi:flagellar M-ring protein FliF
VPNALQNLGQVWTRATLTQRVMMLGMLLACVGAVVLLVGFASKPTMAMLYSALPPEEAAKIVEKINDEDIPYELKDGGTTIYVPSDRVHSLRLTMAAQGLPAGENAGYEILKDQPLGAGPIRQRNDIRRALEGELARSIRLIDAVVAARVHITDREVSVFRRRGEGASASVVLRLKPGRQLSAGNVAAIVHMVAGAVQGLSHDNVVVIDSEGNLLSNEESNEVAGRAGTLHDFKARVERDMARKAEEMLAAVLGPNHYIVRVSGKLKMKTTSTVTNRLDKDNRVLVQETTKETTSTTTKAPKGTETAPAGGSNETTTDSEAQYAHGTTREQVVELPGEFESWSVAVFVDTSAPESEEGAEGGAAPAEKISDQQVSKIVTSALGLREGTDTIEVVKTSFYQAPVPSADEAADGAQMQFYLEIARKLSLGILVIGALVALWMLRGTKKKAAAPDAQGQAAAGMLPAGQSPQLARSRIAGILEQNPEQVKKLFHSWVEGETQES